MISLIILNGRVIVSHAPCLIIAEAGINHNGGYNIAVIAS